jgi:Spy/CpxP family protein refolding chaperone
MEELRAKEHTLATSEKPDMKAINANIDEMTKVQNQLMKAMASHRQDIRSLLTEEQKIRFDSRPMGKGGSARMRHGLAGSGDSGSELPPHMAE